MQQNVNFRGTTYNGLKLTSGNKDNKGNKGNKG